MLHQSRQSRRRTSHRIRLDRFSRFCEANEAQLLLWQVRHRRYFRQVGQVFELGLLNRVPGLAALMAHHQSLPVIAFSTPSHALRAAINTGSQRGAYGGA